MPTVTIKGLPRERLRRLGSVVVSQPSPAPVNGIALGWEQNVSLATSASVYDSDGIRVRKLWSLVWYDAGSHSETWNGLDDDGNQCAAGTYTIEVMGHDFDFQLDQLFTTGIPVGPGSVYRHRQVSSVRIDPNGLIFRTTSLDERTPNIYVSDDNGATRRVQVHYFGVYWSVAECFSDGTSLYVLAFRTEQGSPSAYDWVLLKQTIATKAWNTWSSLTPDGNTFPFTDINVGNAASGSNFGGYALPLGQGTVSGESNEYLCDSICVANGIVAISMPNQDEVRFYDASTGAQARTALSLTNPTALAFKNDGSLLFVAHGAANDNVSSFSDDTSDFDTQVDTRDEAGKVVCDIGYDSLAGQPAMVVAGAAQWVVLMNDDLTTDTTRGTSTGYDSHSAIAADYLHFEDHREGGCVSFDDSSNMLVHEYGLNRTQLFTNAYVDDTVGATMFSSESYRLASNLTDPTRFCVNGFTIVDTPWDGSWTLEEHYGQGLSDAANNFTLRGIQQMITVSGHTYGRLKNVDGSGGYDKIVELTATGRREIADLAIWPTPYAWDTDFNAYKIALSAGTYTISKKTFAGLDGSNDPTWGDWATWGTFTADESTPIPDLGNGATLMQILSNGAMVISHNVTDDDGEYDRPHIGAFLPGTGWLWKESFAVEQSIPFPRDGSVPGYNAMNANANLIACCVANTEFCVLVVNGEFYGGGQAGRHIVFNKTGHLVGVLGHPVGYKPSYRNYYPAAGENGNSLQAALVKDASGVYHYLHSNEAQNSGIHAYTFANGGSYGVLSGSGSLGSTLNLGTFGAASAGTYESGAIADEVDFDGIADGDTITGFTDVQDIYEIASGQLRVKSPNYDKLKTAILYRAGDVLSCEQRVYVPAEFFNGAGYESGGNLSAQIGVVARYNTSTGLYLMGVATFDRFGALEGQSQYAGGVWRTNFLAYDGTTYEWLGGVDAFWQAPDPGVAVSLRFLCTGTQPTKLVLLIWDETNDRLIADDWTELSDAQFESTGKCGLVLGMQNQLATRWERRAAVYPLRY